MKLHLNNTIVVLSLLTLISMGVFGYIFWSIYQNSQTVANLNTEINTNKENLRILQNKKVSLVVYKPEDAALYFVRDGEESEFIGSVEDICVLSKITCLVKPQSLQPSVWGGNFKELGIAFEGKGRFGDILKFVSLLEVLPYKSNINRIDMTYNKDTSASSTTSWQINMSFGVTTLK